MNKITKAFTLIEGMVCVSILAIILGLTLPLFITISPQAGKHYMWQNHRVYVVAEDWKTSPHTYLIRTEDNREIHVSSDELTPDTAVEKQ